MTRRIGRHSQWGKSFVVVKASSMPEAREKAKKHLQNNEKLGSGERRPIVEREYHFWITEKKK